MPDEPWKNWIPGVLSDKQLKTLCNEGYITNISNPDEIVDVSSINLRLSNEVYHLVKGSIKPSGGRYLTKLKKDSLIERMTIEDDRFTLKARNTYLVKLKEKLDGLNDSKIYGQATARSSVGRVDVLARLIVDGMDCYEGFSPEHIGNGELFLEITPITFPVQIREDITLTQLRLFYWEIDDAIIGNRDLYQFVLSRSDRPIIDGSLSVDLSPSPGYSDRISAFSAIIGDEYNPIPLWKQDDKDKPNPTQYWKPVDVTDGRIIIEKGKFYILKSKERIKLPPGFAVYCRANDETIGEMRIHYAGFVHPYFGFNRTDGKDGTPLIFEVRGHDVNVVLQDDEKMANLTFYKMSEISKEHPTDYKLQELQLSSFFQKWPTLS